MDNGKSLYLGVINCLKDFLSNNIEVPQILLLDIGMDGVGVATSSTITLWPRQYY